MHYFTLIQRNQFDYFSFVIHFWIISIMAPLFQCFNYLQLLQLYFQKY